MKEVLAGFFAVALVGVIEAVLVSLAFMWALHNLHHYVPAVPALGFFGCAGIAIPFAVFLYIATSHDNG